MSTPATRTPAIRTPAILTPAILILARALVDPDSVRHLDGPQWSALISVARAEVLLGTLAERCSRVAVPPDVAPLLAAARDAARQAQVHALWEAEMCRRALAPLGITPVLLKGTAYAAAGLCAAAGRQIGDLDILVPRDRLGDVEAALLAAGWEWVKDDPYDQSYYREHMHELPPLIHRDRDRMIDVHHTILPLTARITPDAGAMLADTVVLEGGLAILSPEDRIIHCAAHLIADGELDGGLRNLWDFHCLHRAYELDAGLTMHEQDARGWRLVERARHHGLERALWRALRLSNFLFDGSRHATLTDRLFLRRLTARDDWGRERRPLLRLAFYMRGHLLRMPLPMLLRHLWTKWRA